jgi:CAAX prenyl protease-like protein
VGAAIFVLWIAVARLLTVPLAMPAALAQMPSLQRTLWVLVRVAAAVISVPIAEELAFRGYLLRRLESADFEAVHFRRVGATALLLSAVIFGIEHGALWLPGVVAGLAYAGVLMRTGRIGEAVAAHGTTNALLAAYVLIGGQWQLW